MNIFRILAQGDGAIQEPNISAFLGYLLNPNEDHGLGSRFLEPFLEQHCIQAKVNSSKYNLEWLYKEDRIIDLSTGSNYEINVFFEQAFGAKNLPGLTDDTSSTEKKEVVDIILIIHEVEKQKREKYFENYLRNERILKHIFLIEVKISDSAVKLNDGKGKEGQLTAQVKGSKDEIKKLLKNSNIKLDPNKDISFIFVTPDTKTREKTRAYKAFEDLKNKFKDLHSSHIFWNTSNNDEENNANKNLETHDVKTELSVVQKLDGISNPQSEDKSKPLSLSIEQMLDDIIKPQPEDKSEPLPLYTTDTLQSFSNFIYSGFSYKQKRQKGERKNDGTYTKEYTELNERTNIEFKLNELRDNLIKKDSTLESKLSKVDLRLAYDPKISLSINDIIIEILANSKSRDSVSFLYRANPNNFDTSRKKLVLISNRLKIELKMPKTKVVYCRTKKMQEQIKIIDTEKIYDAIIKAIEFSK